MEVTLIVKADSLMEAECKLLDDYPGVNKVLEIREMPKVEDSHLFADKQLAYAKRAYKKVTLYG